MRITEDYRGLNQALHESRPDYGTTAKKYARQVSEMIAAIEAETVLDYGCGKGLLGQALSHHMIREYDPAIPGKDDDPEPADLVVSIDVMEHIEPECLEDVLDHIQSLARKAVFLTVATRPAVKFLADGRNAHLIVHDASWWLPKILDRWDLRLFQASDGEFACMALAKPPGDNGA